MDRPRGGDLSAAQAAIVQRGPIGVGATGAEPVTTRVVLAVARAEGTVLVQCTEAVLHEAVGAHHGGHQ